MDILCENSGISEYIKITLNKMENNLDLMNQDRLLWNGPISIYIYIYIYSVVRAALKKVALLLVLVFFIKTGIEVELLKFKKYFRITTLVKKLVFELNCTSARVNEI